MHLICASYRYDREVPTPEELLDRYPTLIDWANAVQWAGGRVTVVQRFCRDAELRRDGVVYRFVRDPALRFGHLTDPARRINRIIASLRPDVVHVHGMPFLHQAAILKRLLPQVGIVVQDHAGGPPTGWLIRLTLHRAMRHIDAVSFAVPEQVAPWREVGILDTTTQVIELPESSSRFHLTAQDRARHQTGLCGDPLCLWVGRLNANKDPLTVLHGFALAAERLPDARLAMVYGTRDLLPQVQQWLGDHPTIAARVRLLGRLPHERLEAIYNSSDFFLLGSDYDGGSGYSVLEALSCGVVPIITDIPSFRAVTADGEYGGLWPVGDAGALAATLLDWQRRRTPLTRERVRAYFDAQLSFEALGRQAMVAYRHLMLKDRRSRP